MREGDGPTGVVLLVLEATNANAISPLYAPAPAGVPPTAPCLSWLAAQTGTLTARTHFATVLRRQKLPKLFNACVDTIGERSKPATATANLGAFDVRVGVVLVRLPVLHDQLRHAGDDHRAGWRQHGDAARGSARRAGQCRTDAARERKKRVLRWG